GLISRSPSTIHPGGSVKRGRPQFFWQWFDQMTLPPRKRSDLNVRRVLNATTRVVRPRDL
ncbi:MAG: hypothetical protein AAFQ11_13015, partial [Pseudomonadota bacterium]